MWDHRILQCWFDIDIFCIAYNTGVRVVPLVRGEARHDKQGEGDEDVGGQHVQPDLYRQRVHETGGSECHYSRPSQHPPASPEQSGGFPAGDLEQDGDAEVHEGFGKVDHGLAEEVDRHRPHRDIRLVLHQLLDEAVPLVVGPVERPVVVVRHQLDLVVETDLNTPVMTVTHQPTSKLTWFAICSSRSTQNPSNRSFPLGAGSPSAVWRAKQNKDKS